MPAVKNVGEPCAREPHARFDAAAGGIWCSVGNAVRVLAPPADPTAPAEVVLLLAQEGGRLVTSLDVTVEDRPLGNPVRRVAGLPSAAPYVVRQAQFGLPRRS
jgi:hypothetical protein